MSLQVIKQGVLDTVQDGGRFGYQHLGINPNGVMDAVAAGIANMLVGNNTEAVIELHFPAAWFKFQKACIIALCGAEFQPLLDGKPVFNNTAIIVAEGSILTFAHNDKGSRCYLAVGGGFKVDVWLNSFSTNVKASIGGFRGRQLMKGDVIEMNAKWEIDHKVTNVLASLPIRVHPEIFYNRSGKIKCVEGIEYNWLNSESKKLFHSGTFKISLKSDRMGYHLQGAILTLIHHNSLLSSAVSKGTIQLLPSGQLIVLMADHQTTGGYPKVAQIITADLATLAQMRPNENVQFTFVTLDEAEEALYQQQQQLQQLRQEVNLQLDQFFRK